MELTGTVSSGLGRAHVFMAQPHYQEQFRTVLGSKAWPGTLNMEIDKAMLSHYIALRQKAGIDTLDAPEDDREAAKALDVTVFFYNPNIHPKREYEIRKDENKRYAASRGIPFVDCDYDAKAWFERVKGLEYEPERGARCTACFDMRMEVTAAYAAQHGFPVFTTTNATSRWATASY